VRLVRRFGEGAARRLAPALLCALAAHALVWRSLEPHAGDGSYAHAYQPLIGVAGLVAVAAIGLLAAAALTREYSRTAALAIGRRTAVVGSAAAGWLVLQESAERSLSHGRPTLISLAPSGWALLALVALAAALAVTAAGHAGMQIVRRLAHEPAAARARHVVVAAVRPAAVCPVRRSVLSLGQGMRAPPVLL
jgi:hypothetical protein